MSWTPIHDAHSIERVRIIVRFTDPIPPKLISGLADALEPQKSQWGFGPRKGRQSAELTIHISGGTLKSGTQGGENGWIFTRNVGPNEIIELLSLEPTQLIYEIAQYKRWDDFMQRFVPLMDVLSAKIESAVDIESLSLEYFDRFTEPSDVVATKVSEVIKESVISSVPRDVVSGGEMFHIHRGWFEGAESGRVLINQNVDLQQGTTITEEELRSLLIYTKVERRRREGAVDLSNLKTDLDGLHDISKRVLSDVMQEAAQERIGLTK